MNVESKQIGGFGMQSRPELLRLVNDGNDIRVGRGLHLAENVLILARLPECGKTMLAPIAGALPRIELMQYSLYGVIGLTRQMAAAYAKDGITVNCVAPSRIMSETLMENVPQDRTDSLGASNPTGRLAEPHEMAQTIGFPTTEGASYINGTVIDINGGQL